VARIETFKQIYMSPQAILHFTVQISNMSFPWKSHEICYETNDPSWLVPLYHPLPLPAEAPTSVCIERHPGATGATINGQIQQGGLGMVGKVSL
jgi:hypothetical protein